MNVVSNKECSEYYKAEESLPNSVVETQICAKDPENIRDTCQVFETNIYVHIRVYVENMY